VDAVSLSAEERLATLEQEMRDVRDDVREIRASLKTLEALAAKGGGAFNAILLIGGLIGWIAGIGAGLYAIFRHGSP